MSRLCSSGQWSGGTKAAESMSVSSMAKCSSSAIFPGTIDIIGKLALRDASVQYGPIASAAHHFAQFEPGKVLVADHIGQGRPPSIVLIDPVRISLIPKPGVGPRAQLYPRGAGLAGGFEATEGVGHAVPIHPFQATRKHCSVLDRHGGALRHIGHHGMASVTQKGDVPLAPPRQRIPIDQRPFVDRRAGCQNMPDLGMEADEGLPEFRYIAHGRPRLDRKTGFRLARHEVDFTAIGLDIVDHDMPIGAPPFGTVINLAAVEESCREYSPIGDLPSEIRLIHS